MIAGFVLMSLSWLAPNKAYPWLPAWNEGLAFVSVLFLWFSASVQMYQKKINSIGIGWPVFVISVLGISLPWVQYAADLLIFYGDAIVVSLYFACFFLALHAGTMMGRVEEQGDWGAALISCIVISAIFSVGIALVQWTKTWDLAVFMMESGAGERPGSNIGQINHVNTLCFMGFCGVFHLYRKEKIGILAFLSAGCFLQLGMALTQSRTGWLQIAFLVVVIIIKKEKFKNLVLLMAGVYVAIYLTVPLLESKLFLSANQNFRQLPVNDVRMTMWFSLLQASALRPWFGYGWLQTGWAQQATAIDYPILRSYMSYSHNFVLDLIIWCGWPLAILMACLILIWFASHLASKKMEHLVYLYCAIAGVFIHGLLEYPLAYAYFMMPVGLMMGYIDGRKNVVKEISLNLQFQFFAASAVLILFVLVAYDYIRAVSTDVAVRMQASQIGRGIDLTDAHSDFKVLNQLAAMYVFRMMQHDEFADDSKIVLMDKVVQRYPYSPALFQYAWARAMRGEYDKAEDQLRILCSIYSVGHCAQIKKRWIALQQEYPDKVGRVSFPEITPSNERKKLDK